MRKTQDMIQDLYPNGQALFSLTREFPPELTRILAGHIGLQFLARLARSSKAFNKLYRAYLAETETNEAEKKILNNDYAKYLFFTGKGPCEKFVIAKDFIHLNGEKDIQFHKLISQLYTAFTKTNDKKLKLLINSTCERLLKLFISQLSDKNILVVIKLQHLVMDLELIDQRPYFLDDPVNRRLALIDRYKDLSIEARGTLNEKAVISSACSAVSLLLNTPPKIDEESERNLYNDKLNEHKRFFETAVNNNRNALACKV